MRDTQGPPQHPRWADGLSQSTGIPDSGDAEGMDRRADLTCHPRLMLPHVFMGRIYNQSSMAITVEACAGALKPRGLTQPHKYDANLIKAGVTNIKWSMYRSG